MPKKQPKNAFYFYMLDFKEEQRKKGVIYKNMAEVAEAAGPVFPKLLPHERAKYEAIAKAEKAKANIPERKFTSTGVSLAELEAQERARRDAADAERRDILNFVKNKSVDRSIQDEDIFLIDVNCYCKVSGTWLVGEFTLLRFSLHHGVKNTYHEFINIGDIPLGYALDVKLGSKELGLPMPDDSAPRVNYVDILAKVIDYLRVATCAPVSARQPLPPLYTLPDKVPQCVSFIQTLCSRSNQSESVFRVYQLDTLFYQLVAHIPARADEGFPKESLALLCLRRDPFKYSLGLACETHVEADKSVECTSARVKGWAFTVLDKTCALLALPPLPAHHVPADFDMEAITTYKDERRRDMEEHYGPDDTLFSVSDTSFASDLNTTRNTAVQLNDSTMSAQLNDTAMSAQLNDTAMSGSSGWASVGSGKSKRVHVPLRMPKEDYSLEFRTAPEIANANLFPPLGARPSRGRGRGLLASLSQLHM